MVVRRLGGGLEDWGMVVVLRLEEGEKGGSERVWRGANGYVET